MMSIKFCPVLAANGDNILVSLCNKVGIPPAIGVPLILILAVLFTMLGACSYAIWLERKLAAWIQDRLGPNRVGWAGLLQPIADGAKFLLKEDIIPSHVDKVLFVIAPTISVFTTMLALSVVPLGPTTPGEGFNFIIAPKV